MEDMDIPWHEIDALFVGGGDPWKDSKASQDIVRTAKILGKHVHVGRVNTRERYELFAGLGADTCDGSGVSRFPHTAKAIFADPIQTLADINAFPEVAQ
jgi:EAL domain-containing protein (putative c-di-GMP-specific phosphodiesterase class I)